MAPIEIPVAAVIVIALPRPRPLPGVPRRVLRPARGRRHRSSPSSSCSGAIIVLTRPRQQPNAWPRPCCWSCPRRPRRRHRRRGRGRARVPPRGAGPRERVGEAGDRLGRPRAGGSHSPGEVPPPAHPGPRPARPARSPRAAPPTPRWTRSSPKGPAARSIDNLLNPVIHHRRGRVPVRRARHRLPRRPVPPAQGRRRRGAARPDPRQPRARARLDDPAGGAPGLRRPWAPWPPCSTSTRSPRTPWRSTSSASSGGGSSSTTSTATARTTSSPPTTWSSPPGSPINLDITSMDVIHSFWIPALNGKKDAVPGRHHPLTIEADEPGIYRGQCTEFCGLSHAYMRMRVVALPQDEFDAWLANQVRAGRGRHRRRRGRRWSCSARPAPPATRSAASTTTTPGRRPSRAPPRT